MKYRCFVYLARAIGGHEARQNQQADYQTDQGYDAQADAAARDPAGLYYRAGLLGNLDAFL